MYRKNPQEMIVHLRKKKMSYYEKKYLGKKKEIRF